MNIKYLLGAAALIGALMPGLSRAAEVATATISETQVSPGENQYSITLHDTGTTTVGTFWFGWIPGDNFMPAKPTDITSPGGWGDKITSGGPSAGFAIQWTASSSAVDLASGGSLTGFSFDSSLTLAQLEAPSIGEPGDPVDTAFIYSGTPFSDAGFQLTPTAAPEPSPAGLGFLGLGMSALALGWRKLRRRTSV